MSVKKFIAPQLAILLILSAVWLAGVDNVVVKSGIHQDNLHKYLQVQRRVIDNYFGDTTLDILLERSIFGIVKALNKDDLDLAGTPIDTTAVFSVRNLRDSFNRYEEAYLYVANNYPDTDMTKVVESSIREMLKTLDPHSVYIEAKESEQIQEQFAGKFQGIGIQFNVLNDTITVIAPITGGPSDQLGIMSGDRIIAINDTNAVGYDNEDVIRRLRGEKGTTVDVKIQRPRNPNPINFSIVRDDIPITTIDTHYMIDDKTGYIKVNRFAATTHDEFLASSEDLKEQGMERLILDLRNNPGGYLSQAIAMAEEFFPRGTKLVSTKSRHTRFNSEYLSRKNGSLKDIPVITLVNAGSASASEIVSGAIQDHDRGLVVGNRTFGKGLVQQQYELIDNSNIRVTISRYYTPSGRLIQKPFEGGSENYAYELEYDASHLTSVNSMEFKNLIPDSLRYQTAAGRDVFGGGGIVPDIIVQQDTTTSYALFNFMLVNRIDFDFVREYLDANGDNFRANWEDRYQEYRTDFSWNTEDEAAFIEKMESEGMVLSDEHDEPTFEDNTLYLSEADFNELKWMNFGRMKAELARQVWGSQYFYPVINDYLNETLNEAINLWDEAEKLEMYVQTQAEIRRN